jgi:hypothetical protein
MPRSTPYLLWLAGDGWYVKTTVGDILDFQCSHEPAAITQYAAKTLGQRLPENI